MKHNYTDTELQAAIVDHKALTADEWAARCQAEAEARNRQYNELECTRAIAERALTELAKTKENGLSRLRPLSEAGEVPEGCVRVTGYKSQHSKTGWVVTDLTYHGATHFADIRLPAPVEKPDPYAELKKAHADGKIIQFKPYGCPWEESDSPDFTAPIACYRIKPKPETFEAHGRTWIKHTPGDAMPCDGELMIDFLMSDGCQKTGKANGIRWKHSTVYPETNIIGWRYVDEPTPEPMSTKPISPSPTEDMALGGQMYWRDLARQLADVWWKCYNVGASLQHGDIDTDVSFSICCELHGGKVFHADTPVNAWLKAERWLMSPDRENFPTACFQPA